MQKVKNALKVKPINRYSWHDNNLLDWRKRDNFIKLTKSKELETIFFNFYKNKTNDSIVFEEFLGLDLSYQLIAYLYFIKDRNQYLPIAQERFDKTFMLIGLSEFKTSGKASWNNYKEYIDIIKRVKEILKEKDQNTTLLDAHSFLYILGNQMQKENFSFDFRIVANEPSGNVVIHDHSNQEQYQDNNDRSRTEVILYNENLPEEMPNKLIEQLFEGAKKTITINAFERSTKARELCIEYWKPICAVCEFNFEKVYGEIGRGFIHVHHLIPLWQIGSTYEVDPINDLRPICPNCHAMLHKQEETLTIEKLKSIIVAISMSK